jgi:hypothetical protein
MNTLREISIITTQNLKRKSIKNAGASEKVNNKNPTL